MQAFVVSIPLLMASLLVATAEPARPDSLGTASAMVRVATNPPPPASNSRKPLGEQTLDQLFETLSRPGDEARGKAAEAEIQRRWLRSGSATIDLLMGWSQEAVQAKAYGRALDYLDAVTMLKPDYAEGWNRRATIFYLQDQYGKALSDLEKVMALEPRHFGALAGLGMIFREIDRDPEALEAFERALKIDPYLDSEIGDAVKTLEPKVRGKDI